MKIKKLNNKGFSLVELICAVAILGLVVTPLLHSFVTSSNLTSKTVKQSEATLGAQNILETVIARPVGDFQDLDRSHIISQLLSGSTTAVKTYLVSDNEEQKVNEGTDENPVWINAKKGSFSVALKDVPAGSSNFDAVVEFSRGVYAAPGTDTRNDNISSNGIYLINSKKMAQYDSMDGVFCQPFDKGSNPDIVTRADADAKALALGARTLPNGSVADPIEVKRKIELRVIQDPDTSAVYATVAYIYTYTYKSATSIKNIVINGYSDRLVSREYTVFPGGFEPVNRDGSVSIYIMYYPDYTSGKDDITIFNNCYLNDIITRDIDIPENPISLNVYLYKQIPYNLNDDETAYVEDTSDHKYECDVRLYMPDGYQIDTYDDGNDETDDAFIMDTLIYTNAADKNNSRQELKFGVGNVEIFDNGNDVITSKVGWENNNFVRTVDGALVRTTDNIRLYDIKITLYKSGAVTVDEHDNVTGVDETQKVYTLEGTKTN